MTLKIFIIMFTVVSALRIIAELPYFVNKQKRKP